ncbi:MAG TPA: hypothetical protein VFM02_02485 [Candidatus Paceibacterota bacterium]|nr:hypothetical protein [Candidatus Paceibacterota bacterium]
MKKKTHTAQALQSKKDHIFAREIVEAFAESAFINGQLSIEDLSDKEAIRKKLLQILPKRDEDLFFTIVHHSTLLEKGAQFAKRKEYKLAYVFYATYFEHFINEILDIWAKRNSIAIAVRSYSMERRKNSRYRMIPRSVQMSQNFFKKSLVDLDGKVSATEEASNQVLYLTERDKFVMKKISEY